MKAGIDNLCISLVKNDWRRGRFHEGGLRVDIDGKCVFEYEYPEKMVEYRGQEQRAYHTQSEKTAIIAGWIAEITDAYGVSGWVVGKGTLCDFSDAGAEAAGIKVATLKWRRKQVHTLCLQDVTRDGESCPCGAPIYEAGVELCGPHAKRDAKEAQELAARRAAAAEAEAARKANEAERRRVQDIVNDAVMAGTTAAGSPYERTLDRWSERKGQLADIPLTVRGSYDGPITEQATVYIPLGTLLRMCEALTGEKYDISPPLPEATEEAAPPIIVGDVASPF